jgi:hypothetical protein
MANSMRLDACRIDAREADMSRNERAVMEEVDGGRGEGTAKPKPKLEARMGEYSG